MYRHHLLIAALLIVPLSAFSQLRLNRQQKFPKTVPAGQYSGIAPLGNDRYAVVSDKSPEGFFVFHIDIDTLSGRIGSVVNEGFFSAQRPEALSGGRDQEGIAFHPPTGTLFISGEKDNQVLQYTLDGVPIGRRLDVPQAYAAADRNLGLESLAYDADARRFYTTTEGPLPGDASLLRIQSYNDRGERLRQWLYPLDAVKVKKKGVLVHGVSELCAIGGDRLMVIERTVRVPPLKIGAYADCRFYEVSLQASDTLVKRLIGKRRTRINLFRQNFANYEGMCVAKHLADGRKLTLIIADSQNQYRGLLRDWFATAWYQEDR